METKLNELRDEIHKAAVDRGFYEEQKELGTLLMLIVGELGEALEADRKMRWADLKAYQEAGKTPEAFREFVKDTVEDEIADTFIRTLDLCGALGIDIEAHVREKLKYNETREKRHGKRY